MWRLISRIDRNKAIYQSRFAEPADLAALGTARLHPGGEADKEIIIVPASVSDSDPSLHTIANLPSRNQSEREKIFELSDKTLEEIAQSKKWYNRYRAATDMQILLVGVFYMVVSAIIATLFQLSVRNISVNPLSYSCHSGPEYVFPYATMILFLFLLSPYMIFQLKGSKDGFGIRNELIYVSFFSVPCAIFFFVMPALAAEFTRKYLDKTTWVAMIVIAAQIVSVLIPLARHFKEYPHRCVYTGLPIRDRNKNRNNDLARDRHVGDAGWQGSEDIPLEGPIPMPSIAIPAPTAGVNGSARDHYQAQKILNDFASRENETGNTLGSKNFTLKSLIRSQRKERFGLSEGSRQETTVNVVKTDWHEFMRALEDRKLFDKISMFTVREFCAENTRFLYEVSRLEKRAVQYEHLRDMTSTHQGPTQDSASLSTQQQQVEKGSLLTEAPPTDPRFTHPAKSPSITTGHSTLAPLPTRFNSSQAQAQADSAEVPHRIKKIVSASSVSSSVPMLGPRRSSSFEGSEPSSPLGSSSYSTFTSRGLSSTALPDLELGIAGLVSKGATTTLESVQVDHLPAHNATFAPIPMPPTLLIQFEYIYKTFIVSGGRLELNLSYDASQEIHRKVNRGEWKSGMFDGAIYEIQELLFRDVWPKFVTSSQGLNYYGSSAPLEAAPLQEVATSSSNAAGAGPPTISHNQTSVYSPFEHQMASPRKATPPSIQTTSPPETSLSRATSSKVVASVASDPSLSTTDAAAIGRNGSIASSTKTQQARKEDVFQEEPSKTGFKTWLAKKNRKGMTAAALISREGGSEEAQGIIEQSRKSMVDRRSDTSGLYSSSIQNTMMAPRPEFAS
ncbi:hypothetical protein BGZ58_008909 [Dissophora ornata]|nr:hypothetical protein BGZ58_008909 [Dissophora ornata]